MSFKNNFKNERLTAQNGIAITISMINAKRPEKKSFILNPDLNADL